MEGMIESNNLLFRPINEADTDMVIGWRNSEYVKKHFLYRENITRRDHLDWLKYRVKTGEVVQFIIIEKKSKTPIGSVYFRDIDRITGYAEYGIFIGEDKARGKGYGNETAVTMVGHYFDKMAGKRLILRVLKDNVPAIRSYERAGFRRIDDAKDDNLLFMEIRNNDKRRG